MLFFHVTGLQVPILDFFLGGSSRLHEGSDWDILESDMTSREPSRLVREICAGIDKIRYPRRLIFSSTITVSLSRSSTSDSTPSSGGSKAMSIPVASSSSESVKRYDTASSTSLNFL